MCSCKIKSEQLTCWFFCVKKSVIFGSECSNETDAGCGDLSIPLKAPAFYILLSHNVFAYTYVSKEQRDFAVNSADVQQWLKSFENLPLNDIIVTRQRAQQTDAVDAHQLTAAGVRRSGRLRSTMFRQQNVEQNTRRICHSHSSDRVIEYRRFASFFRLPRVASTVVKPRARLVGFSGNQWKVHPRFSTFCRCFNC